MYRWYRSPSWLQTGKQVFLAGVAVRPRARALPPRADARAGAGRASILYHCGWGTALFVLTARRTNFCICLLEIYKETYKNLNEIWILASEKFSKRTDF